MSDLITAIDTVLDRLAQLREEEEARLAKLHEHNAKLLLADALAALRVVDTRKMSDGQKSQIAGVKDRLRRAIA